MEANQQFSYLQTKMEELGSAIFFNLSDSVLKLPTSIITKLKVDDFGYVWFYVQKPNQHLQEFEKEFPVRLDFFRKGKEYFVQADGNAWAVTDPEEINTIGSLAEQVKESDSKDWVLVKVKITRADYHESRTSQRQSWWENALQTVSGWLGMGQTYRTKNTYIPAS